MEIERDLTDKATATFESDVQSQSADVANSNGSIIQPERDPRIPVRKGATIYVDEQGRTITRLPMNRSRRISPDNVGSSDWRGARTFMRSIDGRRES